VRSTTRRRRRFFALDGCVVGDGTSAGDLSEAVYLRGFGEQHAAFTPNRVQAAAPTPGSLPPDIDSFPTT